MVESQNPHLLILEARFHAELADALLDGATTALTQANASYDIVSVPGALELPPALSMVLDATELGGTDYDGFVVLGLVIRGGTTHFDAVAGECHRALMDLAVSESLAIGNGIVTVETAQEGWTEVRRTEGDRGGAAARAALSLIALREKIGA